MMVKRAHKQKGRNREAYLEHEIAVMGAGSLLSLLSNAVCMVSLLLKMSSRLHMPGGTLRAGVGGGGRSAESMLVDERDRL